MNRIEPTLGLVHAVYDPCFRGVKIAKIAIAPERGVRSLRPFGPLVWYVFARESRLFYLTASVFVVPEAQDTL